MLLPKTTLIISIQNKEGNIITQDKTDKQEKQHHRASLCPFVFAPRLLCAFPPCVQVFTSVWCGVTLMNRVRAFDHICRTLFLLEMQCIGQDDIFDNHAQIKTRRDPAAVYLI